MRAAPNKLRGGPHDNLAHPSEKFRLANRRKPCDYRRRTAQGPPPTMMMRTKKTRMMMTRTTKSQQSSENRTNVDAKDSGLWLLEITDYR